MSTPSHSDLARTGSEQRLSELATDLANHYMRLPGVVGFAIGGSLARSLVDENSDLEVYCYYDGELPDKTAIQQILDELGATTVRSPDLHWDHPAWGVHSFFSTRDVTVELGYRDVTKTANKLDAYLFAGRIQTAMGDHDVPFGHYPSGLAACLADCRIMIERDNAVTNLQAHARQFPPVLRESLLDFHVPEAQGILSSKLAVAHQRSDLLHFNAGMARVLRSTIVATFALNERHFPGDKWNGEYLKYMTVAPKGLFRDLEELLGSRLTDVQDRERALVILESWVDWIATTR